MAMALARSGSLSGSVASAPSITAQRTEESRDRAGAPASRRQRRDRRRGRPSAAAASSVELWASPGRQVKELQRFFQQEML